VKYKIRLSFFLLYEVVDIPLFQDQVEKKLSQMILDKTLQGKECFIVVVRPGFLLHSFESLSRNGGKV